MTTQGVRYNGEAFRVRSLQELRCAPGTTSKGVWQIGSDTTGRLDEVPAMVVQGAAEGPTLWIQGAVHGDEPNAAWTVTSLAGAVHPQTLRGRLILLPVLNVAAFRARVNPTPCDHEELYRAFPGDPHGSYTAQLGHAIGQDLLKVADYLIDVHSGTPIYFCADFASYPGGLRASEKSEEMARATNSPIIVQRRVQSEREKQIMFMYACSQGIPSVMISNGGHRRVEEEFYGSLRNMCLNVMRHLRMIPGEVQLADRSAILRGINYTFCTKAGFVFYEAENGDWLTKDQVLARLCDVFGNEVEAIRCPYDKAQLIERAYGVLFPGELVAEWFLPMS